jgi:hypothetical protein
MAQRLTAWTKGSVAITSAHWRLQPASATQVLRATAKFGSRPINTDCMGVVRLCAWV